MPLNLRASNKMQNFDRPVSYKINDRSGKFLDAKNVYSTQNRLDTRPGSSRVNAAALPGGIQSLSAFIKSDSSRSIVAKVGTQLLNVLPNGAYTVLKTGLDPLTVHRGITGNDRHFIAIEKDGLFSWDGTKFSPLGQKPPEKVVIAEEPNQGQFASNIVYKVGVSYYSTQLGFETNITESSELKIVSPNSGIRVTDVSINPDNTFIDKVYIYLKNVSTNSPYLFIAESLSSAPVNFVIQVESKSSQVAPINNGTPIDGGGKYLGFFNSKLCYAGGEKFPNEVYFSEIDVPDAFNPLDDATVLSIPGQGTITGLGVGLFSDSVLDPFLAIFKRKSIHIYSEIGGAPKLVLISNETGCVSTETIQVKNGVIYFLSDEGFRAISNGRLITNQQGDAITLGNGDIDDIFKTRGFQYEINRNAILKSFSAYYPTLDQYITWVAEGQDYSFKKAYVYEFALGGFRPYEFSVAATCSVVFQSEGGVDMVLFGTSDGYIIKHSILEEKSDVDATNTPVAIDAYAILPWVPEDGDYDATYSFRELIVKAKTSIAPITVKTFLDYDFAKFQSGDYDFTGKGESFILDESLMDEDVLGDDRMIVTARSDINRVGESLAIGFYQKSIGANLALLTMQIDSSKNGNRNLANDNDDEEGGFDSESRDYFSSVSDSVKAAQAAAQRAEQAAAQAAAGGGLPPGGLPGDFLEKKSPSGAEWKEGSYDGISLLTGGQFTSTGLKDTLDKIIRITYTPPQISLSMSPGQSVREKGTVITSVDMNATVTKKSNDIAEVRYYRNGALVNTNSAPAPGGGAMPTYTNATSFSDTMSFYARVDDIAAGGNGPTIGVQSNTVTFPFVYPYYYGAGVPGKTAAQVAALTKAVVSSNANYNVGFTAANGDVFYFAYPASYGALTSILDPNGFETLADWTLTTANITGLDGNAVSYRIYAFNNPVVAGSTSYTFKR